ncbi:MAG: 5-(carboxyamino)imidazole ribonucleotide synthase [Myxococcota bacterium]
MGDAQSSTSGTVDADDAPCPFPTVGILGGGQLGRMMAAAAMPLGVDVRFYQDVDAGPASPAAHVTTAAWTDADALKSFLDGCSVVTLDNEWVDLEALSKLLPAGVKLWPSPDTMALISDKGRQKDHARAQGLPLGEYRVCDSLEGALEAAKTLGYPMVAKRPHHSYDGYGNATVRDEAELRTAYEKLVGDDGRLLLEAFVDFVRELAVMVARRPGGEDVAYPVAHTVQRDHRCDAVEVPAPVSDTVTSAAAELARKVAAVYGCVGVVGVELFELADGTLLVNELAPRPHNSGHYTIDACVTSQFENHLRAVLDLPLGSPALKRPAAVMINVLGHRKGSTSAASLGQALAVSEASIHLYGKQNVRPGRKMGHVTALADTLEAAEALAREAADHLRL